jgi:predicted DNA-binding transcriptional regulator AlpA
MGPGALRKMADRADFNPRLFCASEGSLKGHNAFPEAVTVALTAALPTPWRDQSSMTDLLPPAAAALELGISEKTLTKWRRENKGPTFVRTSGDRVRYSKEALNEWRATQVATIRYTPLECVA